MLGELQRNLRLISVVVCLAVLALFGAFSTFLSRRVRTLLGGIRTVREGEYTHRISMSGHDELAQLAEEFNQLTGRLQVNEEERRRFVSDASHELKTPLASIRLMTDSILQDASIDRETTREFVADISDAADRLIHISQELLELDRLDQGRDLDRRAIDLNEQAEQIGRMLAPLAESAQVTMTLTLGEGCLVRCNDKDAGQILKNLMENAIKYNVEGGSVKVSVGERDGKAFVSVADTGIGIAPEHQSRIFERFYRVDKSHSKASGGTGLGLSIVKHAVQYHHGTVKLHSEEGKGTTICILLPKE